MNKFTEEHLRMARIELSKEWLAERQRGEIEDKDGAVENFYARKALEARAELIADSQKEE